MISMLPYARGGLIICILATACCRVSEFVLDEACQVFGGRAITRTGMGQVGTSLSTAMHVTI